MRKLIFFFVFILGLASMAYGGQKHTVELTDGSRIEGEVISLENGRYTLRTAHLGEIKVEASKVRKIETSHESAGPQGNLPEIPDAATIKTEMDKILLNEGKKICQEVGDYNLPVDLIKQIGKYKFRFSYGQNRCLF